ncbi:lipase family protein, partial [Pantoea dispersa]|nr:lipase family protein [Pantoea dispersa]
MANNSLVTSIGHSNVDVMAGKQTPYWVEFQLVDEQGDPVANMPWTVESAHPVSGPVEGFTYSGQSDADGLIRVDMPHGLELRLTLDGNQLATEMEKRALRVSRDAENDSVVRSEAEEKGYIWHYAVIGELCRTLPSVKLRKGEVWPPFHFPPQKIMKGVIVRTNELEKRHVIEICPFRAALLNKS